MNQQNRNFFPLVFFAILFLFLNILTLKDGHNWGGDFSQYILHAKNLLEHQPYAFSYDLEPKVVCPVGFPLLLVPLLKCFGTQYFILKSLNVIFWLLFVLVFYPLLKRNWGEENSLLGAVLLFSMPYIFIFKQNVVSDIPFLFFTMAALVTGTLYFDKEKAALAMPRHWVFGLFLFLMGCAFLIRWAGCLLFLAAAVYVIVRSGNKRILFYLAGTLLIAVGIQNFFGASWASHLNEVSLPFLDWVKQSYNYTLQVVIAIVAVFFPVKTPVSILVFEFLKPASRIIPPVVLLMVTGFFVIRTARKQISFIECFFALYFFALLLWRTPDGTGRYVLPLVAPLLLFMSQGVARLWGVVARQWGWHLNHRRIASGILLGLIFYNVVSLTMIFDFNDDEIYKKETGEMVRWIKENTRRDEIFMFKDPRVLGLLTDRFGIAFDITGNDFPSRVKKFHPDYLVLERMAWHAGVKINLDLLSRGEIPSRQIVVFPTGTETVLRSLTSDSYAIEEVWGNRRFRIVRIFPK